MIKMQVIGNLGRDATNNVVSGKNVMNFTVAHTEKYRDSKGEQKDRTIWVDCSYWTDRTGILPFLIKGTQVYVEGAPDLRQYTRNDGTPGASLTLRVFNIQLLGNKGDREATGSSGNPGHPHAEPKTTTATPEEGFGTLPGPSDVEDDLPF